MTNGQPAWPTDVSIRSRRLSAGEAAPRQRKLAHAWFQSAPADCRREKHYNPQCSSFPLWFQSAPADCRREKQSYVRKATRRKRFNPLPPTVGGRRPLETYFPALLSVSIRSRRLSAGEGAAGPPGWAAGLVSIRSRRLSAGEGR